jgi:hypothetical protein
MYMKRLFVAAALVAATVPGQAAAQTVGGKTAEYVEAHANWLAGRFPGGVIYRFLSVWRDSDPIGASDTIAQLGTVRCRSGDDRGTYVYSCRTRGRLIFLRDASFDFDPTLRSARIEFKALGHEHAVAWKATDDRPKPDYNLQGGERAMTVSAALSTPALVKGHMMGERFSTKKDGGGRLRRGVDATAIHDLGVQTLTARGATQQAALRALRAFLTPH